MSKDVSFRRYFNPDASPHTVINPVTGHYDYYPKHENRRGRVVWDSLRKGPYVRAKHGELPLSKRKLGFAI